MYKKNSDGWLKHIDFILLDLLCVQAAFFISYVLRLNDWNPYAVSLYRNMAVFIEREDGISMFVFDSYKNVLKRGYYIEFTSAVKQAIMIILLASLYLVTVHDGNEYSRMALYLMGGFYCVLTYVARILWKKYLKNRMSTEGDRSLVIITTSKIASQVVRNIKENNFERFQMNGIIILGRDMIGEKIRGVPVLSLIHISEPTRH